MIFFGTFLFVNIKGQPWVVSIQNKTEDSDAISKSDFKVSSCPCNRISEVCDPTCCCDTQCQQSYRKQWQKYSLCQQSQNKSFYGWDQIPKVMDILGINNEQQNYFGYNYSSNSSVVITDDYFQVSTNQNDLSQGSKYVPGVFIKQISNISNISKISNIKTYTAYGTLCQIGSIPFGIDTDTTCSQIANDTTGSSRFPQNYCTDLSCTQKGDIDYNVTSYPTDITYKITVSSENQTYKIQNFNIIINKNQNISVNDWVTIRTRIIFSSVNQSKSMSGSMGYQQGKPLILYNSNDLSSLNLSPKTILFGNNHQVFYNLYNNGSANQQNWRPFRNYSNESLFVYKYTRRFNQTVKITKLIDNTQQIFPVDLLIIYYSQLGLQANLQYYILKAQIIQYFNSTTSDKRMMKIKFIYVAASQITSSFNNFYSYARSALSPFTGNSIVQLTYIIALIILLLI